MYGCNLSLRTITNRSLGKVGASMYVRSGRIGCYIALDPFHPSDGEGVAWHPESEFGGPGVSPICLSQRSVCLSDNAPLNGDGILSGSTALERLDAQATALRNANLSDEVLDAALAAVERQTRGAARMPLDES